MELAIQHAWQAYERGEVPVGAVIVQENRLIAADGNRREEWNDPTAHAEIVVMRAASQVLGSWRLAKCHLFVTLEPCLMCGGAIIGARIPRLYYGCHDPAYGAVSLYQMCMDSRLNHAVDTRTGLMEAQCREPLERFFQQKRQ